uniref:DNA topoisomerase I n=1 Tax=Mucochytrium quahogii TaxID=96639 RepID=A0A7S2W7J0_9STRA|mmetsp:Transcript_15228/g.32602  ORF Transcript_15228/g.32602 Transcript_15228/m.32602 type:complete len:692 (+) Transcript_15228:293-2368(+)|eukprot:CAMPEP_0203756870 /NCGR_PEP_ID=MMETSP0098-20131031/10067_1 /ASSEMBLY_ACC=CAM_ASM_000208 /TAXON_ID=96639 /ORGANISM=" , Strain NY0313808BC1" /LENGTH=691 /DNA_ID=CAMNT_0050648911 /DNA_START=273 /DNA_END=2348 /DNA_ORIENTATION=+
MDVSEDERPVDEGEGDDGSDESEYEDEDDKKDKKVKKEKKSKKSKKHKKHKKSKKSSKKRRRDDSMDDSNDYDEPIPVRSRPAPTGTVKVKKEVPRLTQLETAMKAHKWWEDPRHESGTKWTTLEHNGVMFPPPYKSHGIKLIYDGREIELTPEQEEVATLYADMPLDGPQLGDPKTAETFNRNFFADFREVLGKSHPVKWFDKIDWTNLREYAARARLDRRNLTKEEKELKKKNADAQRLIYSYALVDGHLQKIGNVMVEPPGLFRGRGDHPKTGKLKKRVMPEQITINVGKDSPVPKCPIPGRSWKAIVHKPDVTWLAYWKDNINNNTKYVWLAASSGFKGQADMEKYEKARRLKKKIGVIRSDYERKLGSKDLLQKQLGTAMWVIDRLALRVGNEKDDDEADTVGCCSLRVEHVSVDTNSNVLTLDFLGKDSMRHFQSYRLEEQYGSTGIKVLQNFETFLKRKKPSDDIFDKLDVGTLNDHLKTLMPGLSAKVFRTFNASKTLEEQLPFTINQYITPQAKTLIYNAANREVAILCNHQRTVSTAAQSTIEKMSGLIELMKDQREELVGWLQRRRKDKPVTQLKPELPKDASTEEKRKVAHMFTKQPSVQDCEKRIAVWDKKIQAQELTFQNKEDNKTVALGTSKINYMDPRITVAWAKRNEVPIEKLFATSLRDKFPWAMSVPDTFTF